jgi:hypothetical protein
VLCSRLSREAPCQHYNLARFHVHSATSLPELPIGNDALPYFAVARGARLAHVEPGKPESENAPVKDFIDHLAGVIRNLRGKR